eukprot:scaffold14096_cov127-Cylindrotheca_fusiformis.AAC.1
MAQVYRDSHKVQSLLADVTRQRKLTKKDDLIANRSACGKVQSADVGNEIIHRLERSLGYVTSRLKKRRPSHSVVIWRCCLVQYRFRSLVGGNFV